MFYKMTIYISFILLLHACENKQSSNNDTTAAINTEKTIKKNIEFLIDECWNNKNTAALDKITVENFTRKMNGIQVAKNQLEMDAHMQVFFTAFPDLLVEIDSIFVKDNQTFTHWHFTGTNTGIYGENRATGKKVKISGHSTIKFDRNGKMLGEEVFFNELEMLQQLGYTLVPPVLQ